MSVFYFAWVDPTETTFGDEHHRTDEDIVSFNLTQAEGDFATLTLTVRNPKIGLLATGRKTWAWFGINDGDVNPLFFGRLAGLPTNILAATVDLVFNARPADFVAQKQALADTLKVRPYYDPVFLDETARADPDTVLEGYAALFDVDRVTHAITITDIITGEDGIEEFVEDDVPYDSVEISMGEAPLVAVQMNATVNWTQAAIGNIDAIAVSFDSWMGSSMLSAWPKTGASLGGGWTVTDGNIVDVLGAENATTLSASWSWESPREEHNNGDIVSVTGSATSVVYAGQILQAAISGQSTTGINDPFADPPVNTANSQTSSTANYLLYKLTANLTLGYGASRGRTENVLFTLTADTQPILTDVTDDMDIQVMTINGAVDTEIESPSDSDGTAIPIGDVSRRSYFPTDRGLWSLEYLIALARAQLISRSRTVNITFKCRMSRMFDISCRKNALLHDHRLPGGSAVGKISSYEISGDGSSGVFIGSITISCAIGYGGSVAVVPGDPVYVEEGYVDAGYQFYASQTVVLPATDVSYAIPVDSPNDDGLVFPLTRADITAALQFVPYSPVAVTLPSLDISNPNSDLTALSNAAIGASLAANDTAAVESDVWLELILPPLTNGPFTNTYTVEVSSLKIPKQIDLEAAAT